MPAKAKQVVAGDRREEKMEAIRKKYFAKENNVKLEAGIYKGKTFDEVYDDHQAYVNRLHGKYAGGNLKDENLVQFVKYANSRRQFEEMEKKIGKQVKKYLDEEYDEMKKEYELDLGKLITKKVSEERHAQHVAFWKNRFPPEDDVQANEAGAAGANYKAGNREAGAAVVAKAGAEDAKVEEQENKNHAKTGTKATATDEIYRAVLNTEQVTPMEVTAMEEVAGAEEKKVKETAPQKAARKSLGFIVYAILDLLLGGILQLAITYLVKGFDDKKETNVWFP